jgi:hypothetical protein
VHHHAEPSYICCMQLLNIEVSNEIFRAPVAASLLGGLLVLLFNIASCEFWRKCTCGRLDTVSGSIQQLGCRSSSSMR